MRVPRAIPADRRRESLSVRLVSKRRSGLSLRRRDHRALSTASLGTPARSHRSPRGRARPAVARPRRPELGTHERDAARASHPRPRASAATRGAEQRRNTGRPARPTRETHCRSQHPARTRGRRVSALGTSGAASVAHSAHNCGSSGSNPRRGQRNRRGSRHPNRISRFARRVIPSVGGLLQWATGDRKVPLAGTQRAGVRLKNVTPMFQI